MRIYISMNKNEAFAFKIIKLFAFSIAFYIFAVVCASIGVPMANVAYQAKLKYDIKHKIENQTELKTVR